MHAPPGEEHPDAHLKHPPPLQLHEVVIVPRTLRLAVVVNVTSRISLNSAVMTSGEMSRVVNTVANPSATCDDSVDRLRAGTTPDKRGRCVDQQHDVPGFGEEDGRVPITEGGC
jgi:hypothetical protein